MIKPRHRDGELWAHFVYHIDEGLGRVPIEATDHLNLILSCENFFDQRDEFARGECTIN